MRIAVHLLLALSGLAMAILAAILLLGMVQWTAEGHSDGLDAWVISAIVVGIPLVFYLGCAAAALALTRRGAFRLAAVVASLPAGAILLMILNGLR